jgi:50S ribosomal subunit-associated GTPase HflX
VAANKIDALDDPDRLARLKKHLKKLKVDVYPISSVTGEGVPALLEAMWRAVAAGRARLAAV